MAGPDLTYTPGPDLTYTPDAATEAPKKPRGAIAEIANQGYAGVVADLPEMVGKAAQYATNPGDLIYGWGKDVADSAKARGQQADLQPDPENHNIITNTLASGARMIPQSIVPAAVVGGAIAGAGVAAPGALLLGSALGSLPAAMSQGQTTLDKAEEAGVGRDVAIPAARKTALIEGAGETLGTFAGAKLLGLGGKALSTTLARATGKAEGSAAGHVLADATDASVLKPWLKQIPETLATEVGTEMGQNAGEAYVEQQAGIDKQTPWDAAKEAVGPTIGMTALLAPFGLAGFGIRAKQNARRAETLTSADADPGERLKAAFEIKTQLDKIEPEAGKNFGEHVLRAVENKTPLEIGEHLFAPPVVTAPLQPLLGYNKVIIPEAPRADGQGTTPIDPTIGPLSAAAADAIKSGLTPTNANRVGTLLRNYATKQDAQDALDQREDGARMDIIPHPRGKSGFAVVPKDQSALAKIDLEDAKRKATTPTPAQDEAGGLALAGEDAQAELQTPQAQPVAEMPSRTNMGARMTEAARLAAVQRNAAVQDEEAGQPIAQPPGVTSVPKADQTQQTKPSPQAEADSAKPEIAQGTPTPTFNAQPTTLGTKTDAVAGPGYTARDLAGIQNAQAPTAGAQAEAAPDQAPTDGTSQPAAVAGLPVAGSAAVQPEGIDQRLAPVSKPTESTNEKAPEAIQSSPQRPQAPAATNPAKPATGPGVASAVEADIAPIAKPDLTPDQQAVLDAKLASDFERQFQQDLKDGIKRKRGLVVGPADKAVGRSPFKTFLTTHGISDSASDIVGERNLFRANQAIPRLFRKAGLGIDELVNRAAEAGFISEADRTSGQGVEKIKDMIQAEINGKQQLPADMADDAAEAAVERNRRMDIEEHADSLGLPYDNEVSTDRLAGMVKRVERYMALPKNKGGLLKADRVKANALEVVARIERKRAQYEQSNAEFAKAGQREQDAIADVLLDSEGMPVINRVGDLAAIEAWLQENKEWDNSHGNDPDTQANRDSGQAGAPDAQGTGARAQDSQGDGAGQQRAGAEGQAQGLTTPTESDATLARSRRNSVTFSTPYVGKTGAKLVGYEWANKKIEYVDQRGEDRVKRISDWGAADINEVTGRDIVHKFVIVNSDGSESLMSAETAAVALGISESSVRSNAKNLLESEIAKQKKDALAQKNLETAENSEWFQTPAQAVDGLQEPLRKIWLRRAAWGSADSDYPGREKLAPFLKGPNGWQAVATDKLPPGSMAEKGFSHVTLTAKEVWDSNGNDAAKQGPDLLSAPTREEVLAQQAQAEQAAKDKDAADRKADKAAREEDERKRIAKASEAAAGTFELGGNALDNLTGQGSMFARGAQTQTEAFKKWFGDWKLVAQANVSRSARTFGQAKEKASAYVGKPLKNKKSGLVAVVSNSSLSKMLSEKAVGKSENPALHSFAVANADQIFERAESAWQKPDDKGDPNIKAIHRFFAPVNVDGKMMLAKMTVKETVNPDHANRLYSIESVEFNEKSPAAQWVDASAAADGIDLTSTRSARDVLSLAQRVQDFNPDSVSKVVGENGEPMVVYHGTKGDFGVFEIGRETENAGSFGAYKERRLGLFFAEDPKFSDTFAKQGDKKTPGANVMPLYLSIKSPLDLTEGFQGLHSNDFDKLYQSFIKDNYWAVNLNPDEIWSMFDEGTVGATDFVAALKDAGFDGAKMVERGNDREATVVWVALEPTQVKSSIGNNGDFDGKNPNISLAREALRRSSTPRLLMPISEVQTAVDQLTAKWKDGPRVKVVATPEELPIDAPNDARGLIHDGTVYIVAANHRDRDGVARTLGHEAIGHYGLWKMLGEDGTRKFQAQLQLALKSGNVPLNKIAATVRGLYVDQNGKFNLSPRQEANEIAAFAVESAIDADGNFKPGFGFFKAVWAKVAQFLRDLGVTVQFTNAELQGMLVSAMKGLETGDRLEGGGQTMAAAALGGQQSDSGLKGVTIKPASIVEKSIKAILSTENAAAVLVTGGNSNVLRDIARKFGKQIVFFRQVQDDGPQDGRVGSPAGNAGPDTRGDGKGQGLSEFVTNGFTNASRPDVVFLNADSSNHLLYILGHEFGHTLRTDDRKLWVQMAKELQPLVRNWSGYKANSDQVLPTEDAYAEELFGDVIGQNFLNPEFWQDMEQQSPSLFRRIANKAIAMLDKAIRLMAGRDVSPFISDMEKARSVVAGVLAQYAAAHDANKSTAPDSGGAFARGSIVGSTNDYPQDMLKVMDKLGWQVEVPTLKERAQALWKDAGKKMAQGIADQFAPVKDLDGKAYGLLRLAKGASGAFETLLKGGMLKLTDNVYDIDTANRGGVVDKLLMPLQGEHHNFFRWVAAQRAALLKQVGKEHLFDQSDIDTINNWANTTNANFDYTIQNGVRKGQTTRNRAEMYRDSNITFSEFNKNVMDMAEQSGLIDGSTRHLWENEFYVPFYRVSDDADGGVRGMNIKGAAVRQQAFKALKGGKQKLNADLLENTLMNWAHLLDASAKNRAAKATIEAAEKMGVAMGGNQSALASMGSTVGNKNGVVWFMDGGQKRYSLIDNQGDGPYIMTALSSLEYAGMRNPVMNAMGAMKHALTVGVTASPFFKVRNLIRDSVQVVGTGPISYNVGKNLVEGWKLTDPASDAYFQLLAGGGTIHFGTMTEGSEAKRVQALVESGVDGSTILDSDHKLKAFYRKFIEPGITAYNELGNRGEAVNRAALYNQLRKQGMGHAEASLQARDLMDFSMQGSWTFIRFLTQVVPFMNARIQGLYKLGKAAKTDPARFSLVLGATAMASLALLAAYGDDDDWKKRTDSDRNNFWWFKVGGTAFRIPKPFEIGSIGTLAERGFELAFDKEMDSKRFGSQVLAILSDQLSMNPVPQLVKPVLDVYANIDSFSGTPIENMAQQKLKSEYRFNDKTTMAARGASTALNAVTGLIGKEAYSPVDIDHLLRGYFGWLGTMVVSAGDYLARPATGQPDQAREDYLKKLTGNMASDLRDAPSRYVNQMYTQAKTNMEAYDTWRALMKEQKPEEAKEFFAGNKQAIVDYHHTEAAKKSETLFNNMMRMVERNRELDPDQKRERIRVIQAQKEAVAKRAVLMP